jgi:uncharacterized protein (TIGR02145 family)
MKSLITTLFLSIISLTSFSQEKGTFKDPRDGKEYKTIKIGTQWIMAENLAYKPANGNYWACNSDPGNVSKYGYLYDWETSKKVAPAGWHLPTKKEWDELFKYLGDNSKIVYEKLLPTGNSGFSALFAGFYIPEAKQFFGFNNSGYFWSSTIVGGGQAYRFYCRSNPEESNDNAGIWGFPCSVGMSVRLFRDK